MGKKLTECIGFRVEEKHVAGVSLPVNEHCPRGLRNIISHQMYLPGREIVLYLPDEGVLRTISSYDLEEARGFSRDRRRKFLNEVMGEVQFADRIAIQNSRG